MTQPDARPSTAAAISGISVTPIPAPTICTSVPKDDPSMMSPVSPGDSIAVRLTAKRKTARTDTYGEVAWNVTLTNQDGDQVAEYELLTMVAYTRS